MDCVAEGARAVRRPQTLAGAAVGTRPIVVPILIALNVLVYLVTAAQAGNPMRNSSSALFHAWALWPPQVAAGEWWRLATSGFLHFGLLHLALNMFALWVLGRDLEVLLGRARFIAVYLVSLLGGGVAVYLFGELGTQVAGASGAVFGLMGGIAVAAIRLKVNPRQALMVIGINLLISITIPGISLLGHLGGLVIGALAVAGMVFAPRDRRNLVQGGTVAALLVLLVVLFVIRDVQLGEWMCVTGADGLRCGQVG
ncbi:membrane associated rhomboid family serine protease [Actinoalloteichus hoggarensis]|uniref:rhomboid family intramembrane serine protease n=1 Tax=Actinoalloteichus hoggarensis TaxID=1470176 RepID=UPI00178EE9AD|nr:rhomboid family intramembrane serine protease [Actinoalloteichus hoggarensis]MBB5922821.1 membrane associated rhomboid family serine protease [Actinoalloteichus hoggarensis]